MATAEKNMPPAMILCGGRGTRLREVTELLPKPMVPIGEYPIIWHIMKEYAAFGVKRFILCLGYKQEAFIDFFTHYHLQFGDLRVRLNREPQVECLGGGGADDWEIILARTGLDTKTGGRVLQAAKHLLPDDHDFFLTYGDGVADIDMNELLKFHLQNGKMLTMSAVHPPARFGEVAFNGAEVSGFYEKNRRGGNFINGGYMVLKREFVDKYLAGRDDCFFEQEPMNEAVAGHEAAAFHHEGFWQCMDNPREYADLNDLWRRGCAPWTKYW